MNFYVGHFLFLSYYDLSLPGFAKKDINYPAICSLESGLTGGSARILADFTGIPTQKDEISFLGPFNLLRLGLYLFGRLLLFLFVS